MLLNKHGWLSKIIYFFNQKSQIGFESLEFREIFWEKKNFRWTKFQTIRGNETKTTSVLAVEKYLKNAKGAT